MTVSEYFRSLHTRSGLATEHVFWGELGSGSTKTPPLTLNMEIVNQIAKGLGLTFVPEPAAQGDRGGEVCFAESSEVMPAYRQTFAPIDLLDYIYAVLHSPTYRETYKEFLKIDFPRVPYPTDAATFWKLVALGGELRALHLMESPVLNQLITEYPVGGENEVEKISFVIASETTSLGGGTAKQSYPDEETASTATADLAVTETSSRAQRSDLSDNETASAKSLAVTGRVYINTEQYFDSVPEVAWNFYIGGYQPAQKWLKDRKGRILDFEDIMHYQRIIKALTETDRVMGEIDGVGFMD